MRVLGQVQVDVMPVVLFVLQADQVRRSCGLSSRLCRGSGCSYWTCRLVTRLCRRCCACACACCARPWRRHCFLGRLVLMPQRLLELVRPVRLGALFHRLTFDVFPVPLPAAVCCVRPERSLLVCIRAPTTGRGEAAARRAGQCQRDP